MQKRKSGKESIRMLRRFYYSCKCRSFNCYIVHVHVFYLSHTSPSSQVHPFLNIGNLKCIQTTTQYHRAKFDAKHMSMHLNMTLLHGCI